jgi:hypothetical protein
MNQPTALKPALAWVQERQLAVASLTVHQQAEELAKTASRPPSMLLTNQTLKALPLHAKSAMLHGKQHEIQLPWPPMAQMHTE